MVLIPVALVINAALALMYGQEHPIFGIVIGCLVALGAIGWLLILAGRRTLGAYFVMASMIPMVPIGLVGAFGARQILDKQKEEQFRLGSLQ